MGIIRPKSDLMLESEGIIDGICAELKKKIGATFFSHSRIFDDGSRIDLHNHSEMIADFYYGPDEMYKVYTPEVNPKENAESFVFLDSQHDDASVEFLRHGYDIDHMIARIDKHDDYCDVWNFGATRTNYAFYTDFLSNTEFVNGFIRNYLLKADHLIQRCLQDRIIIQPDKPALVAGSDVIVEHKPAQDIEVLTDTERNYCKLLSDGLSRSEIAKMLFKSPRTVDAHIQNIRLKLNCTSKSQLLLKLFDLQGSGAAYWFK